MTSKSWYQPKKDKFYFQKFTTLENYEKIAKLVGIENPKNINIFDKDGSLILLHYINPKIDSHVRGIVVDIEKEVIVCKSFPYTEEFTDIFQLKDLNFPDYTITNAYEGTILRLFNYNDKWYLSTHKKINGRESRWSGREFGELFDEVLNGYSLDNFDKKYTWIFLLSHNENKIIIDVETPKLYLTGIFDGKNIIHPSKLLLPKHEPVTINKRINIPDFHAFETLFNELNPSNVNGLLLYNNNEYIKLSLREYDRRKRVRGNNPNIEIRFLELYKYNRHDELVNLFPQFSERFVQLQKQLEELLNFLEEKYTIRNIQRQYHRIEPEYARIVDKIYYQRTEKDEGKTIAEQIFDKVFSKEIYNTLKFRQEQLNQTASEN